jgi:hypothetical protein
MDLILLFLRYPRNLYVSINLSKQKCDKQYSKQTSANPRHLFLLCWLSEPIYCLYMWNHLLKATFPQIHWITLNWVFIWKNWLLSRNFEATARIGTNLSGLHNKYFCWEWWRAVWDVDGTVKRKFMAEWFESTFIAAVSILQVVQHCHWLLPGA